MNKENKVQFNIKNVHYAPIVDGVYQIPKKVSGAVNINLDPTGELTPFYADGIVFYNSVANNGYNGDLEMAKIPEEMLKDIWGYHEEETSKVLIETADIEPVSFALLFQIDGDATNSLYCMYNCTGTRPPITAATNTETKEPQTQTTTISSTPLENGDVYARTQAATPEATKENWFKAVYQRESEAAGVNSNTAEEPVAQIGETQAEELINETATNEGAVDEKGN